MMKNKTIAVWFSCGAASAVAAYITVKKYSNNNNILIFNTYVDEEDIDNIRFKNDVEKWINHKIIDAKNDKLKHSSAEKIWKDRKYMSGINGAPCTMLLKKQARYQKELEYNIDYHVLGFTFDEINRHERFITFERANVIPVLIDERITKNDCFNIIINEGLKLPEVYKYLDNANCIGCVKATGIDYWQRIRKYYPNVFNKRAKLSRELNVKLIRLKGKRIYLDQLPINAKGRKTTRYECGIFCDIPYFKKSENYDKIKKAYNDKYHPGDKGGI